MLPSVSSALPMSFERRQQHRSPEVEQQMLEQWRCGHGNTNRSAATSSNNASVRSDGTPGKRIAGTDMGHIGPFRCQRSSKWAW